MTSTLPLVAVRSLCLGAPTSSAIVGQFRWGKGMPYRRPGSGSLPLHRDLGLETGDAAVDRGSEHAAA